MHRVIYCPNNIIIIKMNRIAQIVFLFSKRIVINILYRYINHYLEYNYK